MKKTLLTIGFTILTLAIAVFVVRFVIGGPEDDWICASGQWIKHGNPSAPMPAKSCDGGIIIESLNNDRIISSPLTINGYIDGKNNWTAFEGQTGIVKLFDANKNLLSTVVLKATEDWMQSTVHFEANLIFAAPTTENGELVFYNENPSGMAEKNQEFHLPVKFDLTNSAKTKIKVYFNNSRMDPEYSCNKVFPVEREVIKTATIAKTALEELLKGPKDTEKSQDFFTSINTGVKINKITIVNGVATADFDEQLQFQVGGSCRVSAIRAQIEQTLKQFPAVNQVIISINGNSEDILQP